MTSPHFHVITDWSLNAPRDKVWPVLIAAEQWPSWWRALKRVELVADGDESGVGAVRRMTWSTLPWSTLPLPSRRLEQALPLSLTLDMHITRVEPMRRIEGEARGAVSGRARWDIWPDGQRTRVRYDWIAEVMEPRLRQLAPLLRQVFVWQHNKIMASGFKGLVAALAAPAGKPQPLRKF
jgi:uncharacterized protein YndB with AHSA1/START domain